MSTNSIRKNAKLYFQFCDKCRIEIDKEKKRVLQGTENLSKKIIFPTQKDRIF